MRRDTSLTYRLLRIVNSPIYGIYKEVRSVEAAITGDGRVDVSPRDVASGAERTERRTAFGDFANVAGAGAFCELAARKLGEDSDEQYLLGMLSLLPAMLGVPMEEIVPILPLRGQICEALAGTANPERKLLGWLESHEHGDWEACDRSMAKYGLDSKQLAQCYIEAVSWAEQPSTA